MTDTAKSEENKDRLVQSISQTDYNNKILTKIYANNDSSIHYCCCELTEENKQPNCVKNNVILCLKKEHINDKNEKLKVLKYENYPIYVYLLLLFVVYFIFMCCIYQFARCSSLLTKSIKTLS